MSGIHRNLEPKNMNSLLFSVIAILALLVSLSTHEYSHALVAYLLGDETAKRLGRLTLNPMAHIDPIGTILVPLMGALSGFPLIGWAKPVPFNPYNLRYRKWGPTMVALAGPISNIVMAFVYLFMLKGALVLLHLPFENLLVMFLFVLVLVNVVLAIFNFLPVPPLDGSKLLAALLDKPQHRHILVFMEKRGPMILLILIMLDFMSPGSVLGSIFSAALSTVFSIAGMQSLMGII